ncbi:MULTISPECIES: hypothetical protein [Bacillus]|uniref:hypothetical protein n=1 Tax=Bacillus TaxID=1386 RepID=UPI000BFE16C8|nr:hypothetical protein [Bacillus wiedmannii]PHE70503.1 hypothetical protein COF77_25150 [Bacillus wiedmannii]
MKPSAIIQTESNSYRFKIKYSTLCDLKDMGIDLLSTKGNAALQEDPTKFRFVFWKGLEAGEMRKFTQEEAFEIFDEVMEEVGPEEFSAIIPKALAIKTKGEPGKK